MAARAKQRLPVHFALTVMNGYEGKGVGPLYMGVQFPEKTSHFALPHGKHNCEWLWLGMLPELRVTG